MIYPSVTDGRYYQMIVASALGILSMANHMMTRSNTRMDRMLLMRGKRMRGYTIGKMGRGYYVLRHSGDIIKGSTSPKELAIKAIPHDNTYMYLGGLCLVMMWMYKDNPMIYA